VLHHNELFVAEVGDPYEGLTGRGARALASAAQTQYNIEMTWLH
jgi:hypothetical protein